MVGCEDVVIQLQVNDWRGLASFGDFCITATFQGCSQETRHCRDVRRCGRLPLLYVWRQRRQRLPRVRSADLRVEVCDEAEARVAFLHISLREAQDMLAAPAKPESFSWRQLVGGGRRAQLLVGAFFRPANSCDLQPPATAPHSPAMSQRTPVHSRPQSGKATVDFIWDADNQFFRMVPPSAGDQLYRFAARVHEAKDLDLLLLGHRGCGGAGGLRLVCVFGGFPALTAGTLASALAAPSADDSSALCFRGSVDAFQQVACAQPASLRLVDGRGNCIGHATFQLGSLLSGQLFQDFSIGDGACDLFEAEHVLTLACDEEGSVPAGADGSVPTVTLTASMRRISFSEWQHRGQLATSCSASQQAEATGPRSSSSVSPAHYSPVSTNRSQGAVLWCDEESAGNQLRNLTVSPTANRKSNSRSSPTTFPTETSGGRGDQSTQLCRSHPVMPPQQSSGDETRVLQFSPSSLSQEKSQSFPDVILDQSAPPATTSLACRTGNTHGPSASDSEPRFILEHIPLLDLSELASNRTRSIHSGSSSSLLDSSPASSCVEIPQCGQQHAANGTESVTRVLFKNSSYAVSVTSPTINSSEAAENESGSTVPRLILDTDSMVSGREAVKKDNRGTKARDSVRRTSIPVQSLYSTSQRASPLLSESECVTPIEMDHSPSSNKDGRYSHSPLAIEETPNNSQYWATKRKKHDKRRHSFDRAETCATKIHNQSNISPHTRVCCETCELAKQMSDSSRRRVSDGHGKTASKKSSRSPSPRWERGYTQKSTTQYPEDNSSHVMYRARYKVTKVIVFDESLCGVLFVSFHHPQLEEHNVLSKVVIRDANEMIAPSGVVGTVKICSLRGHVLDQVAALPPMLNISHHKVRCDPHLVQAELNFVVAEPGKFALYRVATGEVVGTVHVDLRILGPYRCPAVVCTQLGNTCLPHTCLAEDERLWSSGGRERREVRRNRRRDFLLESEGDCEMGKSERREMEVLTYIDRMYADVCRLTEETRMLQEREEWLDPNVRRVWMWQLESLEHRYERACQRYRKHYGERR